MRGYLYVGPDQNVRVGGIVRGRLQQQVLPPGRALVVIAGNNRELSTSARKSHEIFSEAVQCGVFLRLEVVRADHHPLRPEQQDARPPVSLQDIACEVVLRPAAGVDARPSVALEDGVHNLGARSP